MKRVVITSAFFLSIIHSAFGQGIDLSPSAQTGRLPFASYADGNIDSISVYNGNLSLDIPLVSLPGRELSTGLRLTYNSQKWQQFNFFGDPGGAYTGGWHLFDWIGDPPVFSPEVLQPCDSNNNANVRLIATWVDGLGSKHPFTKTELQSCSADFDYTNRTFDSENGDGAKLYTGATTNDVTIKFKDGMKVEFFSGGSPKVTTPNGNYLERGGNGLPPQDTLARTIGFQTDFDPGNPAQDYAYFKKYTITDSVGTPRTYTLNFIDHHQMWNPWEQQNELRDGVLVSIQLPDTRTYMFEYGVAAGYLTRVILPTGGYIRYVYAGTTLNLNEDHVIQRYISYDGTPQGEQLWQYTRSTNNPQRDVTVTTPEGDYVVHRFDDAGLETQTLVNEANGSIRQTVDTVWTVNIASNLQPINPHPIEIKTTEGAVQRKTTIVYDGAWNATERDETDWYPNGGSGTLISRQEYAFTTIDALPFQRLQSINLSGINPASGQFEPQGKTEFFYDEFSVAPTSGNIPNKGTPGGSRGNPTTIRRHKDASNTNFATEAFHYDDLGHLISHTDPLNHTTQISYADNFINEIGTYDTFAFPTTQTNAKGHSARTQYDYSTGLVSSTFDPRNQQTTRTYDLLNRPLTITEPNGRVTSYTYTDSTPKLLEEVQVDTSQWRKTETTFDKFGRVIKTRTLDPNGDVFRDIEYDGKGRQKRFSQPYRTGTPVWTTTTFNALDRPIQITNPDSSYVQLVYAGNVVTEQDEAGNVREYTNNALGQVTQVKEPNPTLSTPLTTTYSYYGFGPLYSVNQSGQPRTFIHDWLGRKTSETQPESGAISYLYNDVGQVTQRTHGSIVTNYSYDEIDRPLTVTYTDGTPAVTYTYDQNGYTGFLTTAANSLKTTTFTHNTAGQIASEQASFSGVSGTFTSSYIYDRDGRLLSLTYPSGRVVQRSYQSSGGIASDRINTILDNTTSTTLVQNVQDNPAGQVTSRTLSSVVETRSFNTRNQVTGIAATAGASVLGLSYDYGTTNNNGRIRSRSDALQPEHSVNYSYDAMNRLTQAGAVNGSWSIAWTLDAWGNRTAQTPGGLATSLVGSQTLGYSNNRNTLFSYDNAGNVTNDGLHTYLYDAEGQITSVDGGAVTFGYDTEGRRVKKTASSQTTYYFYGRTGLLSEFTTVNTGTTQAQSTDRLNYVVSEQTGTPVLMLAGSGTVLENNRVLPFGELWSSQTASANDQKFTTYLRDQETGNDYAMARFYASRYGRFMSADLSGANIDLADPQSWNAYAYVNGDPIDFTDPSGEGFWSKLLGIGLSIAGLFTGGTTTLLGTILTTGGSVLTGASISLGQPSLGATPPFNPGAQSPTLSTPTIFGTPPFNPGAQTPPFIPGSQNPAILSGRVFGTPPYNPTGNSFVPVLAVPIIIGASDVIIAALQAATAMVAIETIRTWWQARADDGRQDKRLTPGEIRKLKEKGYDPEALKGGRRTGQWDLFKDKSGNIKIKPKDGSGPGEPTGININNL